MRFSQGPAQAISRPCSTCRYTYLEAVKVVGKPYNFAYLAYMAIRLLECHRMLRGGGSIYLHCDPTMSHYLKTTMDCIFGEANFRNEIIWGYEKPRPSKNMWRRNHDIILFYAGKGHTFHLIRVPTLDGRFEKRKPFKRPDGSIWVPKEAGKQAGSWWYDIPSFSTRMTAKERTGYPTQKPLALLERIIKASSNEGDMVLDPFCGCATTCVAAERLDRKWIGIDRDKTAYDLVQERLEKRSPPKITCSNTRTRLIEGPSRLNGQTWERTTGNRSGSMSSLTPPIPASIRSGSPGTPSPPEPVSDRITR